MYDTPHIDLIFSKIEYIFCFTSKNRFLPKKFQNLSFLYFSFSFISGTIGLLLTFYLKLSLSEILHIFKYNANTFNAALTGHAVIMLFFFPMPIFLGGFSYYKLPKMLKLNHFDLISFYKSGIFSFWLMVVSFLIFLIVLSFEIYLGTNLFIIPMHFLTFDFSFKSLDLIVFKHRFF